jgi:hypothetical protein
VIIERSAPGTYVVMSADRKQIIARIQRFQTKWIAWDARTHEAIRGPFGLGGSPFDTLERAKHMIRDIYGTKGN